LSKLRFVIISTDTISASSSYYTPNSFLMFYELFLNALRTVSNERSLQLISLKLRKAYIHNTVFDAYAAGRCIRCVNNNTSVKNHSMCSASGWGYDHQPWLGTFKDYW
ncbi:MAG: hypothetical protein U0L97_02130, partial [Candidatus Saccharimonadaceae bacterium]|nr:hypothetical protein [Candidatus Saccharimonadaceae bacterium]